MLLGDQCLTNEGTAMNCRLLAVTFAALTPMAPGCERTRVSKRAPAFQSMTMQLSSLAGAPQRFIAERDKLEIYRARVRTPEILGVGDILRVFFVHMAASYACTYTFSIISPTRPQTA